MCVRPAAREAAVGCVTLGAMFAASRDARPGAGPACRGTAQPARTGPAAGQAGLRAPRPGGEGARAGQELLQPGFAVGAGPTEGKVGGARKGLFASRGARSPGGSSGRGLARAKRGRGEPGGVGGATPPLSRPSLKEGRGSRHFSSLKIKLFPPCLSLPFSLPGLPHPPSPRARPGPSGPTVVVAAASPSPTAAAAESGGPGPRGWPLGVGGRRLLAPARARHRPTQRHVGGCPSTDAE